MRGNFLECAGGGFVTIFSIHIEEFGYRRLLRRGRHRCRWLSANAAESLGERIANAGQTFGADAGIILDAAVMSCDFELLERFESKIL